MHAVPMWSSSVPVYFYVLSVFFLFFCPQWKSLSKDEHRKYSDQAETERCRHAKENPAWSTKDNYIRPKGQYAVHTWAHRCSKWWNIHSKAFESLFKIRMCLYLGQKEEKTSHTSSTSEKTISVIFIAKCDKNKTIIWCFCLFCSICSWIQGWSTANQEALYEASWESHPLPLIQLWRTQISSHS